MTADYLRLAQRPGWEGLVDACRHLRRKGAKLVSATRESCIRCNGTGVVAPATEGERLWRLLEALIESGHSVTFFVDAGDWGKEYCVNIYAPDDKWYGGGGATPLAALTQAALAATEGSKEDNDA